MAQPTGSPRLALRLAVTALRCCSTLRGVGLLREHLPPAVRHPQVHAQFPGASHQHFQAERLGFQTSALYSVQTWDPASCSGRQCDGIDLPCIVQASCARPAC